MPAQFRAIRLHPGEHVKEAPLSCGRTLPDRHAGDRVDVRVREANKPKEACRTREFTDELGYFANCDESETENDYIKQISGGDFDKR